MPMFDYENAVELWQAGKLVIFAQLEDEDDERELVTAIDRGLMFQVLSEFCHKERRERERMVKLVRTEIPKLLRSANLSVGGRGSEKLAKSIVYLMADMIFTGDCSSSLDGTGLSALFIMVDHNDMIPWNLRGMLLPHMEPGGIASPDGIASAKLQ